MNVNLYLPISMLNVSKLFISLCTEFFKYFQLTITSLNSKAQLDNEVLRNDRQFYVEIAKFLMDRQSQMMSQTEPNVEYLKQVVISSFPKEVAIQIATRMKNAAGNNEKIKAIWERALLALESEQSSQGP